MGIRQQHISRDDDERVVITDIGAISTRTDSALVESRQSPPISTRSWRFLLVCASVAGLLLVASDTATQLNKAGPNTAGVADSCEQIQAKSQQAASPSNFLSGTAVSAAPLVMSTWLVDPSTGREVAVAQVNADGLWIFCATPTELASLGEPVYPGEETLGELPDGMAYVYRQDRNTMVYSVVGVRLRDGSIVDNVTLQDGRTLPDTSSVPN